MMGRRRREERRLLSDEKVSGWPVTPLRSISTKQMQITGLKIDPSGHLGCHGDGTAT